MVRLTLRYVGLLLLITIKVTGKVGPYHKSAGKTSIKAVHPANIDVTRN